ncbi:peptidoglycan recognition protein family protein [Streptomyces sp. 8N706]|uniref:peptidoglycan recognition protein family protein n=1 Tax=Streptomyces sp. 8N706 TaxID=3457416 RepID=UPI003FD4C95A
MWSRRLALGAVVLPLALLVMRDAPVRLVPPEPIVVGPRQPRGAPQPAIVSRAAWRADERMVRHQATYTGAVSAVFIHHTGHPNGYDCADVPAMLRALQTDHVRRQGWDDIGYNFVVDRCGTVYEGRAGGVGRSVHGAHTKGFNADSVGIAALGSFDAGVTVPRALIDGIAKVAAWKLRYGADPRGMVRLVSTNDESKYKEGATAELHVISGHRDSHQTRCPGDALYRRLPAIREAAARLRRS